MEEAGVSSHAAIVGCYEAARIAISKISGASIEPRVEGFTLSIPLEDGLLACYFTDANSLLTAAKWAEIGARAALFTAQGQQPGETR